MKTCCIYYWDNGVGVKVDVQLIKNCLSSKFLCKVFDFSFIENDHENFFNTNINSKFDIGIFNQNYDLSLLDNNRINVYICNEEWLGTESLEDLSSFDHIIVKSKFAKKQIEHLHKNVTCLYFWSRDLFDRNNYLNSKVLHFAGKSIQKNTECLLNNEDIIIFDSNSRFKDVRNINYHTNYVSTNKLERIFNLCDTHVCPSLYEAHGHYMFEGLLCNKNVVASRLPVWEEQLDPNILSFVDVEEKEDPTYDFLSTENMDRFIFRKGYFVNIDQLDSLLFETPKERPRLFVENLFYSNQKAFINFFRSL